MMNHKIIILLVAALCSSCSATTPHENFKNFMKLHVGKMADDPNMWIARYPESISGKTILQSGNTEIGFVISAGARGDCTTYFEVDKTTNIIVGWRFEGSEKDCAIVP